MSRFTPSLATSLLLYSALAVGQPQPETGELEAERSRLTAESDRLQGQIRSEQARLEELQRLIEEMRRHNSVLDQRLEKIIEQSRIAPPTDEPAPPASNE